MALITCSECGQQISDKAEKCPHCGCPTSAIDNNQETTNYETDEPPATSVTQEDIPTQDNNDAPPPSLNTIKKYKNILLYGSLALLAIFFISHGFGISFWWYLVIAVVILCIMGALGLDGKDLKGDLSAAKTMVTTDIICFLLLFSCAHSLDPERLGKRLGTELAEAIDEHDREETQDILNEIDDYSDKFYKKGGMPLVNKFMSAVKEAEYKREKELWH